jgi:hypothetical protein
MLDALGELLVYALLLDAERDRACAQLQEFRQKAADRGRLVELERLVTELSAELEILRATVEALRKYADPSGTYL